jgi:hypothetical protein
MGHARDYLRARDGCRDIGAAIVNRFAPSGKNFPVVGNTFIKGEAAGTPLAYAGLHMTPTRFTALPAFAWLLALLLVTGTASCVSLPGPDRTLKPLPPQQVAERVTVQGRAGPVPEAVQARDLARVRAEGNAALFERHLGVLAAAGEAQLLRGNTAKLLVDGPATFAAMKAAIATARTRAWPRRWASCCCARPPKACAWP